ncbi:hypothetical protein JF66_04495 [Cryobacterium sp. MLB-32]|uniref:LysM peptidoglycan-binding domain-containing protein n=1 Tax=Cryobacterium sp. MLB-32 TaxID=1529318 RepID=UPI0004E65549|nr:LysM peptidoglycan-binding domain-containing protein [Cryobacterium sp. MLB-32]KFF60455.1 hypothetical protein JF66_04495 [Cryobacterium sp. MLB-32]
MSVITSTTMATPRIRLTRRGRVVLMALVASPLVAAAIVLALNGGGAFAAGPANGAGDGALRTELVSFTYVTVSSGESLWDVAQSIAPTADPRDVIVDIISLNQLSTDSVQPGQRLALPAGY